MTTLEPRYWNTTRLVWIIVLFSLGLFFLAKTYHVKASKANYYYKEKELRRGQIRRAKEGKIKLHIKQERYGVTRNIWMQDPMSGRRQFFLEAKSAEVGTLIHAKDTSLKETFFHAKGWFQEELFWEIRSTGERVIRRSDRWVREIPPHRPIPEELYHDIVPGQRVRFFDAETAEWDPETNKLIANEAFFCVLKSQGHELPKSLTDGRVIAKGTTHAITFSFDKKGHQQVFCQGVNLQLRQGNPS
jgi:hypothetical protein